MERTDPHTELANKTRRYRTKVLLRMGHASQLLGLDHYWSSIPMEHAILALTHSRATLGNKSSPQSEQTNRRPELNGHCLCLESMPDVKMKYP